MVLGIIAGVAIMLLCYGVSMLVYFVARRRDATSKYRVEVLTCAFAVLFSIVMKFVIVVLSVPQEELSFEFGIASLFHAVYSGIGGLGFEGLEALSDLENGLIRCLYTGSSLYAGLMAISVITAKVSYEIYSFINIFFWRFSKHNCHYFVFTNVTQDTLLLADSISNKYLNASTKCRIVFSGYDLDAFDGQNNLCRDVMAKKYLYWSLPSDPHGNNKSLVARLGIDRLPSDSNVSIFAFGIMESKCGYEANNCDVITSEMYSVVKESLHGGNKAKIDFYLLTNNEINYNYYNDLIAREVSRCVHDQLDGNVDEDKVNRLIDEYCDRFVINVITEAKLASNDLIEKKNSLFSSKNILEQDVATSEYKVLSLGFGQTGINAMLATYVNTAYVSNGVTSEFSVDVYDQAMDNIGGTFAITHPLMDCRTNGNDDDNSMFKQMLKATYCKFDQELVRKEMCFPVINMYSQSCQDVDFCNMFSCGVTCTDKLCSYDTVIVALGSDELNIRVANALLGAVRHKISEKKFGDDVFAVNCKPLCVAVNVRDEKNYGRINGGMSDDGKFINVIEFGNRTAMYSYDSIIDVTDEMHYNCGYNTVSSATDGALKQLDLAYFHNEKCDTVNYKPLLASVGKVIAQAECDSGDLQWRRLNMFTRESNRSAVVFGSNFKQFVKDKQVITKQYLDTLCRIEHERWNRFYIANGWTLRYSDDEELIKARKTFRVNNEHDCIRPYSSLDETNVLYDMINVANAVE